MMGEIGRLIRSFLGLERRRQKAEKPTSRPTGRARSRDVDRQLNPDRTEPTPLTSARATTGTNPGKVRTVRVIIGLDVGTSFSKVVVQLAGRHLADPFNKGEASEASPCLVPTALSEMDASGTCFLGLRRVAVKTHANIKMPLIDRNKPFTFGDQRRLTAFMAPLLRHVLSWAQAEVERMVGSCRLDWVLNLGLPTESYNDELKDEYRRCGMAAWRLAEVMRDERRDRLTLGECGTILNSAA